MNDLSLCVCQPPSFPGPFLSFLFSPRPFHQLLSSSVTAVPTPLIYLVHYIPLFSPDRFHARSFSRSIPSHPLLFSSIHKFTAFFSSDPRCHLLFSPVHYIQSFPGSSPLLVPSIAIHFPRSHCFASSNSHKAFCRIAICTLITRNTSSVNKPLA